MDYMEYEPDFTDATDNSNLIMDDSIDKEMYIRFIDYYTLILTIVEAVPLFATSALYLFMMVKFTKLCTRPNVVLSQVFICLSGSTFFTLVNVVYTIFMYDKYVGDNHVISILSSGQLACFQASTVLMLFLILDWFITVSPCRFKDKYQKNYPWILGIIYVNSIANATLDFLFDRYVLLFHFNIYVSTPFVQVICSLVAVILCLIYKCVNYSQEIRKTAYRLSISLTFLLIWVFHLAFTFAIFTYITIGYTFFDTIVCVMAEKFLAFLGSLYPVLMFFWLIKRDDHLKACFEHTLKRSVRQYMRNENLDDVESSSLVQ